MRRSFYGGETKSEITKRLKNTPEQYRTEEDNLWLYIEEKSKDKQWLDDMFIKVGLTKKQVTI